MKATPVSFTGLPDTAVAEIAALFGAEAQLQLADHPTSGRSGESSIAARTAICVCCSGPRSRGST